MLDKSMELDSAWDNSVIVIQPKIDIICLKMLQVIGCNPVPVTFNVRRKLFGCCSDAPGPSLAESVVVQSTEKAQQSSQVWNFDFTTESPLPAGRYAWEKVRDSDVPVLYTEEGSDDAQISSLSISQSPDAADVLVKKEFDRVNSTNNLNKSHLLSQEEDSGHGQTSKRKNQEKDSMFRCKRSNLVQTSIKAYANVQKNRISKPANSKFGAGKFLKPRVTDCLLRNRDKTTTAS